MNEEKKIVKIGISGKRKIVSNEIDKVKFDIERSINEILKSSSCESFIGYSALAIGSDTLFVEVVEEKFKNNLNIILPFSKSEYEKDFENINELTVFNSCIEKYGIYKNISEVNPKSIEERSECYQKLGFKMVDECDYMIFVWDGEKPNGKGGTAEIIGYASKTKGEEKFEIIEISPINSDTYSSKLKKYLLDTDNKAINFKSRFNCVWKWSIPLALIASICFAIGLSFPLIHCAKVILATIEFLLVIIVGIIIFIAKRNDLHHHFIKNRIIAELIRIYNTYSCTDIQFNTIKLKTNVNNELNSIIELKDNTNTYISYWYQFYAIKCLLINQINYHNKKMNLGYSIIFRFFKIIGPVLYFSFISLLIIHYVMLILHFHPFPLKEFITLFTIIIPPLYAGTEGWLYFSEEDKIKEKSVEMYSFLVSQLDRLSKLDIMDELELKNLLDSVSIAMIQENEDWHKVVSVKEYPHPIL